MSFAAVSSYLSLIVFLWSWSTTWAQHSQASLELARSVPIADVHLHNYDLAAGPFVDMMDRNNVRWAGAVGHLSVDMRNKLKNRYIAAIGQKELVGILVQGRSFTDPDQLAFKLMFEQAQQGFQEGSLKGFGELHTDNYESSPRPEFRRRFNLDTPMMRRAYELANQYGVFVQIHSAMNETFKEDLLRLSNDFPRVTTILSHCLPFSRPADLRNFFQQRANIVCELSGGGPVHASTSSKLGDGKIYTLSGPKPGWKTLIEEFPERFMLGSDTCCGLEKRYDEIILEQREKLLAYLAPGTVELVAYKNAVRLLRLE